MKIYFFRYSHFSTEGPEGLFLTRFLNVGLLRSRISFFIPHMNVLVSCS